MNINPFTLNLSDDLRERIEESARGNGRSINNEIIARLSKSFDNMPRWSKEKIAEARADLAMLFDPNPSNICFGDGYYANSLVRKYGMSTEELALIVGKPVFKTILEWK